MIHTSSHTMTIAGQLFTVTVQNKLRNRRMYIRLKSANSLFVTKPVRMTMSEVMCFIHSKAEWIDRQAKRMQQSAQSLQHGIPILGVRHPFRVCAEAQHISVADGECLLPQAWIDYTQSEQQSLLCDLYCKTLATHLPGLLDRYARTMNVQFADFRIGKAKSKWGSCSAKGKLFFNAHLAAFSLDVIGYLVVHELAHLQYRNHSTAFWQLVLRHCPDYKQLRKQLRGYRQL